MTEKLGKNEQAVVLYAKEAGAVTTRKIANTFYKGKIAPAVSLAKRLVAKGFLRWDGYGQFRYVDGSIERWEGTG